VQFLDKRRLFKDGDAHAVLVASDKGDDTRGDIIRHAFGGDHAHAKFTCAPVALETVDENVVLGTGTAGQIERIENTLKRNRIQ